MSLHKLTAGSGYDYLTRQVAAMDSTEKGHTSLASYYTEKGETPGSWMGAGMAGIDGLDAGDVVTAEQMQALFGLGLHPLARDIWADPDTAEVPLEQIDKAALLGTPFRLPDRQVSNFRIEVARRVAAASVAAGGTTRGQVDPQVRAAIRSEVAAEYFRAEHGRDPLDERELAGAVARYTRGPATPVAGFDLTFSPVKSVSTLWAVADPAIAARVEIAHNRAVADALAFLEREALFTRLGAGGVRQVEVRGLVAAAFTHRDSRAGDPDLHTHVAVANKVQTLDGDWRAIDGRILYKAAVTASEVYNTALEKHLGADLGVRFAAREQPRPDLRPIREIVGIPAELMNRWSSRRVSIEARRGELATQFQADHGRPPSPVEALQLAQQATLETRDAKHEPRSLQQQRAAWAREAAQVLGGRDAIGAMVAAALTPGPDGGPQVDAAWVQSAAGRVLDAVQTRRATWQIWHVKAEALRQVRAADVPAQHVHQVVDLVTDEVLGRRCTPLTRPEPGVVDPPQLRRRDGSSMYTVAGSQLYSSPTVVAAEESLMRHAGATTGARIPDEQVDLVLLEVAANGLVLNDGQAAMVRAMATSGARLQLAIAPAGSGKTTAMGALTQAWTGAGGTVVGLATSAAAAGALRDQTGVTTDTIAALTWALRHNQPLPQWAETIGPRSLVIVDEAGMVDTLSLAQVTDFVTARGGSVRLIGDTQQLAAIGAGGVLRDIDATHGALRLQEIVRFTDPAESAASLALREGRHEAIGFYLDRGRVHVGDPVTTLDAVFDAWASDVDAGRDAVMLAATREQVSILNARAQAHTPNPVTGPSVILADGNRVRAGDVILTRTNRRDLRLSATDFVKNGDRWNVLEVHRDGRLSVAHRDSGRHLTLPADYTRVSVDLGYASTINTAQGITADTSHTLLTGTESRQQSYTALTRGRHANHAYLQVVGDGDEHSVIHPTTTHPLTPAEIFAAILNRDQSPTSVTTYQRDQDDPRTHLADAADRYLDALHYAAETVAGPLRDELDTAAEKMLPGLTDAPAWPTLRAELLLRHAGDGSHPPTLLLDAITRRGLEGTDDIAAVLHWRLHPGADSTPGPLPWLPPVPRQLAEHPEWGAYLTSRAEQVTTLAAAITAPTTPPGWARNRALAPPEDLLAAIELWRIATRVPDNDHRPTGPRRMHGPAARYQRDLNTQLTGLDTPALLEWLPTLTQLAPTILRDPFVLDLSERLAATTRAGIDTPALLRTVMTEQGPLPDDHAAAALWWRLTPHLSPIVFADPPTAAATGPHTPPAWLEEMTTLLGGDRVAHLRDDPNWAALSTTITRAVASGWTLNGLLTPAAEQDLDTSELLWRVALVLDHTSDEPAHPDHLPPDDLYPPDEQPGPATEAEAPHPVELTGHDTPPLMELAGDNIPPLGDDDEPPPFDLPPEPDPELEPAGLDLASAWAQAMWRRELRPPLELTDPEITHQDERAYDLETSPVPPARILELNTQALAFYQACYRGSWAQEHLRDRFNTDLADHPAIHPGYAPDSWNALTRHLQRHGASDEELIAAGLAVPASTGRLIDRFRDRVLFPIAHDQQILGFVGRCHPDQTDPRVPKYLNTGDTVLYRKSDQLFIAGDPDALTDGARPVLTEGPMDAIAITLAGRGHHIGIAALGTSLTPTQARQIATWPATPTIATDNDPAGRTAATKDFWLLTPHGLDPTTITLPPGADPASIYRDFGPDFLALQLDLAHPLGSDIVHTNTAEPVNLQVALNAIAARPETTWDDDLTTLTALLDLQPDAARAQLIATAKRWTSSPLESARKQLDALAVARDHGRGLTDAVTTLTAAPEQRHETPQPTRDRPAP